MVFIVRGKKIFLGSKFECVWFYFVSKKYLERTGVWVIDGILVLISVGQSVLGLLIFFVREMHVLISWPI